MRPFDVLFPGVAANETRSFRPLNNPDLPEGTYVLREHYCDERGCDCRRVLLGVWLAEKRRHVATINYAFEPAEPPFEDEPQIFLDPLNPQSDLSDAIQSEFENVLKHDAGYHDRLVRHYAMWKEVVDDPTHPDHHKVRNETHDDPAFAPAFPRRPAAQRQGPKVGPNEPCPCGSGKKYKKCCRP